MKLKNLYEFTLLNESNNILKLNLPKDILEINKLFKRSGHELYVVGGAVRDVLLGNTPKDYDLATDASPEKIKKILKGYKFKDIGEAFAIVFVITPDGNEYEIATFREDMSAGRRPDSVKISTIDKDVLRRDLTINALFYDIDKKEIVDLVGGISDIQSKNIKTVGNPLERFGEDALRKLRAIRFAARIDGKIDKEVHGALIKDNSLKQVSFPRIREEVKSGIEKAKSPLYYLKLVEQYNFWDSIFPKYKINKKFTNTHIWKVQLAELLKNEDITKISKELKTKLSYTEEEVNSIEFMHFLIKGDIENNFIEVLKKVKKKGVKMNDAIIFGNLNNVPRKMIIGLFRHKISTRGNDDRLKGLKGREIGKKIQEIEFDIYSKKWM